MEINSSSSQMDVKHQSANLSYGRHPYPITWAWKLKKKKKKNVIPNTTNLQYLYREGYCITAIATVSQLTTQLFSFWNNCWVSLYCSENRSQGFSWKNLLSGQPAWMMPIIEVGRWEGRASKFNNLNPKLKFLNKNPTVNITMIKIRSGPVSIHFWCIVCVYW